MKIYFIILIIALVGHSGSVIGQITEQDFEIEVMDMNGTDGYYYFHYSVSDKISSDMTKINQINKRLGEELSKITDEHTVFDLIEIIDLIGPKISIEISEEFDLKNLKVLEIGLSESIYEAFTNYKGGNDRVRAITQAEIKNSFYRTTINSQEKSKSEHISMYLKTKFDSEVIIEYAIYYEEQISPNIPKDSLNQNINDDIIESLRQYEIYEMWVTKRDSMEMIMADLIKSRYPETSRVIIFDVVIPEEAEKQFLETDKARQAVIESLDKIHKEMKLLEQKLESNKDLSESETKKIRKEIKILENELKSVQKEGRLLTYEYRP